MKENPQSEFHLFLLWEKAAFLKDQILKDLKKKFTVMEVMEIQWKRHHFLKNLIRFYGDSPFILRYKRWHCGSGPMILIVVRDHHPSYQNRNTTKGEKRVNVNIFDAKNLYRQWSGGGHRVHGSNSLEEFIFDYTMLSGRTASNLKDTTEWDGKNIPIITELIGENGWNSFSQFFEVLNLLCRYLVLRNFENLPDDYVVDLHGDIDLLTDDITLLRRVSNACISCLFGNRALHHVQINHQKVLLDFRYVGDGYYDSQWEEVMLNNRERLERGFYVPSLLDHWYGLLYHAAVHKYVFSESYVPRLIAMAYGLDLDGVDYTFFSDHLKIKKALDEFLSKNKYQFTDPLDLSVHFNPAFSGVRSTRIMRRFGIPIFRKLKRLFRRV